MPARPYVVKCLDAKYDESEEVLILWGFFEEIGEKRIIYFMKKDFHYRGNEVPTIEMHRTAALWKGKRFKIEIHDDPEREKLSDDQLMRVAATFNKKIANEMEKVTEGLANDELQIQRKMGRLMDEGKLDAAVLLARENIVRAKLSGNL